MKKNLIAVLLCAFLCAAVFAGCAQAEPQKSTDSPQDALQSATASESAQETESAEQSAAGGITVMDMSGEEITVLAADKIVSLTPAGTEIVCALGAAKRLVGVDAFSNYPEITQSLEVVGDFNGPDVEKVVALEPDVVLAGNTLQKEAVDSMKKLGLTVVSVEATTFEDIPKSIRLTGEILGAQTEAEQVIADIDAAVQKAQENKPAQEKTVYYAMSYGDAGNWTSGPGSFLNTMIELAGGKCVTQGQAAEWIEYPVEDLVAGNPDIILVDASMGSAGDISTAQGYADLGAVKQGRVYEVNADVFTRPGPRIAQAIEQISEILNR